MAISPNDSFSKYNILPIDQNDNILLIFETPNHEHTDPNLTSPVYNLGINTWPTKEWVKIHTENFIQTVIKPNGLYQNDTVIWLKRIFTPNDINYYQSTYSTSMGTGVVIDFVRIKDHYGDAYLEDTPFYWAHKPL